MNNPNTNAQFTPEQLAHYMGQSYAPTEEQAKVISAPPSGATLVMAGAGAGKTETMAARAVWMVANGFVRPEQILGLTFTKKAAGELNQRIRSRLTSLARSEAFMQQLEEHDERRTWFNNISPTVLTYDAYAGELFREYALLEALEPNSQLITEAERWILSYTMLQHWTGGERYVDRDKLIGELHNIVEEMDNHMVSIEDVKEETLAAIRELESLPLSSRSKALNKDNLGFLETQESRLELLDYVSQYRRLHTEQGVRTFGQQMSAMATIAKQHPLMGNAQRKRFRLVMLDEYQDTGHAQRILLSTLFGQGQDDSLSVTAVGDPMQSIYMFRGATAANLVKFRTDFHNAAGEPARKLELLTSWRNPKIALELANASSEWAMVDGGRKRLVSALKPHQHAPEGEVSINFFDTREEELNWLTDNLQQRWEQRDTTQPFSAAVLIRKNKEAIPIYEKLRARGVPVELGAGIGLLNIPEIADIHATLKLLVDPGDDIALLRLLTGPRWNIGAADIAALQHRAKQLNSTQRQQPTSETTQATLSAEQRKALLAEELNLSHLLDGPAEPILDVLATTDNTTVGMGDALADLGNAEEFGMSEEGAQRLRILAAELGQLRRHSLSKALPDLIADIERMMGIRTEVLTRWNRDTATSIGTSHLDQFAEIVRSFAELAGGSAAALVNYLDTAAERDKGLEAGEMLQQSNCVQILSVHKAKGLEWDIVAVPHADRSTYADQSAPKSPETWVTKPWRIPSSLRGDAELVTDIADRHDTQGQQGTTVQGSTSYESMPELEVTSDKETGPTNADHKAAVNAFKKQVGRFEAREADRLFYVAITRTKHTLIVSGSAQNPENQSFRDPSAQLALLRNTMARRQSAHAKTQDQEFAAWESAQWEAIPGIDHWTTNGDIWKETTDTKKTAAPEEPTREDILLRPSNAILDQREAFIDAWKKQQDECQNATTDELGQSLPRAAHPDIQAQMQYVHTQPHQLGETSLATLTADPDVAERYRAWMAEAEVLIAEHTNAHQSEVVIPLASRLTATEAVAIAKDTEEYLRRLRRPVPMEPQPYSKRGTAFHAWLEHHYGTNLLIDDTELPGAADATLEDPQLEQLKQQFLNSPWANRTPVEVEAAYSVTLAGRVFEGRIDAIFHEGTDPTTGWTVVDWKTGRKPTPTAMKAAAVQLAVYRLAWAKILESRIGTTIDPSAIRAAFHYVATGETYEPDTLPNAEELQHLLTSWEEPPS